MAKRKPKKKSNLNFQRNEISKSNFRLLQNSIFNVSVVTDKDLGLSKLRRRKNEILRPFEESQPFKTIERTKAKYSQIKGYVDPRSLPLAIRQRI